MSAGVVVIGSLNLDRTYRMRRLPGEGESLHATERLISSGGKGANQAVAAAKLGADVALVGAVGTDSAGEYLLKAVADAGVRIEGIARVPDMQTGEAVIFVDDEGRNLIVVSEGANAATDRAVASRAPDASVGWVVGGFEVPDDVVLAGAEYAAAVGARFVVNPSPFRSIPPALVGAIEILVVNEHELAQAIGHAIDTDSDVALESARGFLRVPTLVVTLGSRGAVTVGESGVLRVPAVPVTAVDTSGAGDAFTGAFVTCLADGASLEEATAFAVSVGAFAATRNGTQRSYPSRHELVQWRLDPAAEGSRA